MEIKNAIIKEMVGNLKVKYKILKILISRKKVTSGNRA